MIEGILAAFLFINNLVNEDFLLFINANRIWRNKCSGREERVVIFCKQMNFLLKEVIRYFKFYLDYLYFSSISHFYHIRKESVVKLTSFELTDPDYIYPSQCFCPLMCLVYLQYFKHNIVPGFVMPHIF